MLIFRKIQGDITIECFEASPDAATVIGAQGNIVRHLPSHGISLPSTVFSKSEFMRELASRLIQLDSEVVREMTPQTYAAKSGSLMIDTADPHLVTEMLMATLASFGRPLTVSQICKRIRDDVVSNGISTPWRRSTLWLTVRVAIQTTLMSQLSLEQSRIEYKNFTIFFLAEVATKSGPAKTCSDLAQVLITKIARRAYKMGDNLSDTVREKALKVGYPIRTKLSNQWKAVQKEDEDRPSTIERQDFEPCTALSLERSKDHLDTVRNQDLEELQVQPPFVPNCGKWFGWKQGMPDFSGIKDIDRYEKVLALAAFEHWVDLSLPKWCDERLQSLFLNESAAEDCVALANLCAAYKEAALLVYTEAPEQISNMFFIILELWRILDRLVTQAIPLLRQLGPSIAVDMFDPLLLPKKAQMQKLTEVE